MLQSKTTTIFDGEVVICAEVIKPQGNDTVMRLLSLGYNNEKMVCFSLVDVG